MTARRREILRARARFAFDHSDGTCGYRRVHAWLVRHGNKVGVGVRADGSGSGASRAPDRHDSDWHEGLSVMRTRRGNVARTTPQEPWLGPPKRPHRGRDRVGDRVTDHQDSATVNPRRWLLGRGLSPRADLRCSRRPALGRTRGSAGFGRASTATTSLSTSYNAAWRSGSESTPRPGCLAIAVGTPRSSHDAGQCPLRGVPGRGRARGLGLDTIAVPEQRPFPAGPTS